jgi:hypothetical protein
MCSPAPNRWLVSFETQQARPITSGYKAPILTPIIRFPVASIGKQNAGWRNYLNCAILDTSLQFVQTCERPGAAVRL